MAGPRSWKHAPPLPPRRVEDNRHEVVGRLVGKTDPNVPPDQPIPLRGTSLHLFAQGDGAFEAGLSAAVGDAELESIGVFEAAGSGANPGVGFLVRLPDGKQVLVPVTLRLLAVATKTIMAVHGDPTAL